MSGPVYRTEHMVVAVKYDDPYNLYLVYTLYGSAGYLISGTYRASHPTLTERCSPPIPVEKLSEFTFDDNGNYLLIFFFIQSNHEEFAYQSRIISQKVADRMDAKSSMLSAPVDGTLFILATADQTSLCRCETDADGNKSWAILDYDPVIMHLRVRSRCSINDTPIKDWAWYPLV